MLIWIAGNIPRMRVDAEWMSQARGGGIVGDGRSAGLSLQRRPEGHLLDRGAGGGLAAVSGYFLMFPFYATDIAGMQLAQIVHGTVALLFVAAMLAHIYIGTIGMEGA